MRKRLVFIASGVCASRLTSIPVPAVSGRRPAAAPPFGFVASLLRVDPLPP